MPSPDYVPGAKYGVRAFAGDTNINDLDVASQAMVADIEAKLAGYVAGTNAARLAATALEGRIWRETDTGLWYVGTGTVWLQIPVTAVSGKLSGAVNIAASESRTNTAYGTMPTPDQVAGIVLPANGLIRVWYRATWQESVAGAARAAIFVGANQLSINAVPEAAATGASSTTATPQALSTFPGGLVARNPQGGPSYPGDAATGQVIAVFGGVGGAAGTPTVEYNGVVEPLASTSAWPAFGGSSDIEAAAGTYTISVQFKASSGSVTVSNRKLLVQAISFA